MWVMGGKAPAYVYARPSERSATVGVGGEMVIATSPLHLGIHPVSTHPSVLEELVDGSHIRWGLRVLKAVVSACLLDGYSADRLGS
jgi:hypothetical protein